jgi:transcriptional regulator with XRE-family HTH domain
MARFGLSTDEVMEKTGLDERTIKGILAGSNKPHARTLHRLAEGLGVSADEFFQDPSLLAFQAFDRKTNPIVEETIRGRPELFRGWSQLDFDELFSRFGVGGQLTAEGAAEAAEAMNLKREVLTKVSELLETGQGELLAGFVELLYERVMMVGGRQ